MPANTTSQSLSVSSSSTKSINTCLATAKRLGVKSSASIDLERSSTRTISIPVLVTSCVSPSRCGQDNIKKNRPIDHPTNICLTRESRCDFFTIFCNCDAKVLGKPCHLITKRKMYRISIHMPIIIRRGDKNTRLFILYFTYFKIKCSKI